MLRCYLGVYHTSQASVDTFLQGHTAPKGYRGVRHARLTRSMKQLSSALKTVLIELRYRLQDGESEHISNRVLARATGYSEGYISLLIRQLAGETVIIQQRERVLTYAGVARPFIQRVWDAEIGGFLLTMLVPPELRTTAVSAQQVETSQKQQPTTPTPAPQITPNPPLAVDLEYIQLPMFPDEPLAGDHLDDPLPKVGNNALQSDLTQQKGDHPHDPPHPSIHHADRMLRHGESDIQSVRLDEGAPAGFTLPEVWPLMLRGTPGYSHADYLRDRTKAESRALREHPDHLIYWSVSRGQPVYGAEELRNRERGWNSQGGSDGHRAGDSYNPAGVWGGSADRRVDCDGALSTRARSTATGGMPIKRAGHAAKRVEPAFDLRSAMAELPSFLQPGWYTSGISNDATHNTRGPGDTEQYTPNQPIEQGGEPGINERPAFLALSDV